MASAIVASYALLMMFLLGHAEKDAYTVEFTIASLENGGEGSNTMRIDVHPDWAPHAEERFASLLRENFFDGARFYQVNPGSAIRFGLPGNPKLLEKWQGVSVEQDARIEANHRGFISFAADEGRPTEIIINTKDNEHLDRSGHAPFAEVSEGMFYIDRIVSKYGSKPVRSKIEKEGNAYLMKEFPKLSFIESSRIVPRYEYVADSDTFEAFPWSGYDAWPLILTLSGSAAVGVLWYFYSMRGGPTNLKV